MIRSTGGVLNLDFVWSFFVLRLCPLTIDCFVPLWGGLPMLLCGLLRRYCRHSGLSQIVIDHGNNHTVRRFERLHC